MRSLLALSALLSALGACKDTPNTLDSAVADADAGGRGFLVDVDCDDDNPAVHPDADELCDGLDNDCDGTVDVDALDASTWLMDSDGDELEAGADPMSADDTLDTGLPVVKGGGDCGCSGATPVGGHAATWLLGLLGLIASRRRRWTRSPSTGPSSVVGGGLDI